MVIHFVNFFHFVICRHVVVVVVVVVVIVVVVYCCCLLLFLSVSFHKVLDHLVIQSMDLTGKRGTGAKRVPFKGNVR